MMTMICTNQSITFKNKLRMTIPFLCVEGVLAETLVSKMYTATLCKASKH